MEEARTNNWQTNYWRNFIQNLRKIDSHHSSNEYPEVHYASIRNIELTKKYPWFEIRIFVVTVLYVVSTPLTDIHIN